MKEELLIRYLTHCCTPTEIREIDEWIATDQANADWLFEMERVWGLKDELRFSDKKEIEVAYNRFLSGLEMKEAKKEIRNSRSFSLSWLKYIAAVLLIGLLSTNLYFLLEKSPDSMNVIEVPNGQRATLTLSDGTKVWLNSHSKFTYPANFTTKNRSVALDGEGFFEVAHNKKAPFTVHSDLVSVRVLGTKFNMKAYHNEPSSITLSEGKVEVTTNDEDERKVTLKPNDQVIYSKEKGLVLKKSVDVDTEHSWVTGEIAYIDQRLEDITRDLERKFGVKITIEDNDLAAEVFMCRAKEGVTVEQVLTILKETRGLDFRIEGNQIYIYKLKK